MGVYLYSPDGKKEFIKDSMKTTQLAAEGYTFEPVEKKEVKVDKKSRKKRDK